tara:strand:+ start:582 stop:716 length:135 start_codon:yes stop_codon:yes gene_type:complete
LYLKNLGVNENEMDEKGILGDKEERDYLAEGLQKIYGAKRPDQN